MWNPEGYAWPLSYTFFISHMLIRNVMSPWIRKSVSVPLVAPACYIKNAEKIYKRRNKDGIGDTTNGTYPWSSVTCEWDNIFMYRHLDVPGNTFVFISLFFVIFYFRSKLWPRIGIFCISVSSLCQRVTSWLYKRMFYNDKHYNSGSI